MDGRVLSQVGHHLVFLTNPYYEKLITAEGFEFHPIGTIDDYYIATTPPVISGNKVKDKVEGVKTVKRLFDYLYIKPSKDIYDIVTRLKTADTVILNHFCVYGEKIAAEKLKIKNININLSPHWLRTFHGGIGTCYEALKAGIPQLICYRIDEQKENSYAIKALGVSNELPFKCVNSKLLLESLQIIHSNDVLAKCNEISEKLRMEYPERNLLMCLEKVQAV